MLQSLKLILKEFTLKYPIHFISLFFILVLEGLVVALSVISLIPLADFLINSSLENPSVVTKKFILVLNYFDYQPSLLIFIGIFVFLNLCKSAISTIMTYLVLKIKYSVFKSLTNNILIDFLNARWIFFSNTNHGKLLNTINSEIGKVGSALGDFTMQLATLVKFITYIITPLILSPKITLITLFIVFIFLIPFFILNKIGYFYGKKDVETSNILTAVFNETLQAAKIIIGYGRQNFSILRNLKALNNHISITIKSQILQTFIINLFQPISFIAASVALIIVYNSEDSLSELAAVFWSLLASLPLITSIVKGNYDISNFLPSYEQLNELRKNSNNLKEFHGEKVYKKLTNFIKINNLVFSYPNRNFTLKIDDLLIKKGKVTAIIGESGSGKSTLIDLIMGFNIPDIGSIYLDDHNLEDYNKNTFRSKIGFVPQDTFLFNMTIKENLLWVNEKANEKDITNALQLSNSLDFIHSMPKGINTIVGDRGIKLSGGQKQRISLARALLVKPDILVLDEATSSLDTYSEKLIQDSIEKFSDSMTIIIIAHRLSTVINADEIIILDKGSIIEKGNANSLIKNNKSIFNKLLKSQNLI